MQNARVSEQHALFTRPLLLIVLVGCVAVLIVDAGGALISREANIPYGYFALISFVVYCAIGTFACSRGSIASSATAGLLVALFDVSVGWWIAWQIGPGRTEIPPGVPGQTLLFLSGMFSVSLDTTLATAAGAIYNRSRARRQKIERTDEASIS